MRFCAIICSLGLLAATALADDKIAQVQQQLKNGGYYFGEITGQKDADTTAAIRRYQIRNGLEISGELTDATYKSIRDNAASATPSPAIVSRTPANPQTQQTQPPEQPENEGPSDEDNGAAPSQVYQPPPQERLPNGVVPGQPVPVIRGGSFAGTPYENAPAEVQQEVIVRAQKRLARRDMFRGPIDGTFTPEMEFSLRAYQSRIGLQPTGRLDLQTLAALELLPGANQPVFVPRRSYRVAPGAEPPVRGEWIRP